MYKIEIVGGELKKLELAGSLAEITAEVMASVSIVYHKIDDASKVAGKLFKDIFKKAEKQDVLFAKDEDKEEAFLKMIKALVDDEDKD